MGQWPGRGQIAGKRLWEGAERGDKVFLRGVESARSWGLRRDSGVLYGIVLGRCSQWKYS